MVVTSELVPEQSDSEPAKSSLRRYLTRWLPIPLLLLALLGFATHVGGNRHWPEFLSAVSFVLTSIMMPLGPLRKPTRQEPLDEREQLLRTRARLAGTSSVSVLSIGGAIFFFWVGDHFDGWRPTTKVDWWFIVLFLVTVYGCVEMLQASWTTRPMEEED